MSNPFKILGGISTAIGMLVALFHIWPEISVEPSKAADVPNPLSSVFKLTNEQGYSLADVSIEVGLNCARIGRGDYTAPIENEKCTGPSMKSASKRWSKHLLLPHESYEFTPGDVLFATPGGLLYAQISISISYEPWHIPYMMHKEMRFETRKLQDGTIEWLHLPSI